MKELLRQVNELLEITGDNRRDFMEHIIKTQKVLGDVADHYWDNKNFEGDVEMAQKSVDVVLSGLIMLARTEVDDAIIENMIPMKLKYWENKSKGNQ